MGFQCSFQCYIGAPNVTIGVPNRGFMHYPNEPGSTPKHHPGSTPEHPPGKSHPGPTPEHPL